MVMFSQGVIHVEDLGVTLRTLLKVAADNKLPGKRIYKVAYKDGMLQRKVALIANHRKNI